MKNQLLIVLLFFCALGVNAQTKEHNLGITAGVYIQQYNGNLGNSFFKFNTACFGGATVNFAMYLNKSFDVNVVGSIGDFGYCQTEADASRVVSLSLRCPGCVDRIGMGELRSRMVSGNVAVKYKFANGFFLKEEAKIAPYVYAGVGINRLTDNMKRQCVNVGNHFSVNSGVGVTYNINKRLNIGYNLGIACFVTKKVYATSESAIDDHDPDADDIKMEKRRDFGMQNALSIGINF
ncbi:MAG TPA: outer membrane beta-barrel protein [Bacteroidia bacterium]|jgi:hypothetical protein|nr:outer membrane beta-barrel protein [Bacteroidia bacterium]